MIPNSILHCYSLFYPVTKKSHTICRDHALLSQARYSGITKGKSLHLTTRFPGFICYYYLYLHFIYTDWIKCRFTVRSTQDTELIFILLFSNYYFIFYKNNCKPTFVLPCIFKIMVLICPNGGLWEKLFKKRVYFWYRIKCFITQNVTEGLITALPSSLKYLCS